jgi:hypothetical protein
MLKIFYKVIGFIIIFVILEGCTGKVITTNLTSTDVNKQDRKFKGIIYYLPALFKEESETTIRLDDKGLIVATALGKGDKQCIPVKLIKLVVYADYQNPKLMSYDHGILEAYTFNVNLNGNGTLSAVATESTPDRGETLKNLTEAAGNVAKLAAFQQSPKKKPCTDGVIVTGISPYYDKDKK